jgi:hypothetical protein
MGNLFQRSSPPTYEITEITKSEMDQLLEHPFGHFYGNYIDLKEAIEVANEVNQTNNIKCLIFKVITPFNISNAQRARPEPGLCDPNGRHL